MLFGPGPEGNELFPSFHLYIPVSSSHCLCLAQLCFVNFCVLLIKAQLCFVNFCIPSSYHADSCNSCSVHIC